MKIKLIPPHPIGSPIVVVCQSTGFKQAYLFEKQPDGARVANVTHKGHQARMLQSPDVWEVYDPVGDAESNAETAEEKAAREAREASLLADAEAAERKAAEDAKKALAQTAVAAQTPAGSSDAPPPPPPPPATTDVKTVDQMTDDELRTYAKEKYGREFRASAKRATILAEIGNLGG